MFDQNFHFESGSQIKEAEHFVNSINENLEWGSIHSAYHDKIDENREELVKELRVLLSNCERVQSMSIDFIKNGLLFLREKKGRPEGKPTFTQRYEDLIKNPGRYSSRDLDPEKTQKAIIDSIETPYDAVEEIDVDGFDKHPAVRQLKKMLPSYTEKTFEELRPECEKISKQLISSVADSGRDKVRPQETSQVTVADLKREFRGRDRTMKQWVVMQEWSVKNQSLKNWRIRQHDRGKVEEALRCEDDSKTYEITFEPCKLQAALLGISKPRREPPGLSAFSNKNPTYVQFMLIVLNALFDRHKESEKGKGFTFSSISCNWNVACREHRDDNNVGPSFALSLFAMDGFLELWDDGSKESKKIFTNPLHPEYNFDDCFFDGNMLHRTGKHDSGDDRLAFIFFTHKATISCPEKNRKQYEKLVRDVFCGRFLPQQDDLASQLALRYQEDVAKRFAKFNSRHDSSADRRKNKKPSDDDKKSLDLSWTKSPINLSKPSVEVVVKQMQESDKPKLFRKANMEIFGAGGPSVECELYIGERSNLRQRQKADGCPCDVVFMISYQRSLSSYRYFQDVADQEHLLPRMVLVLVREDFESYWADYPAPELKQKIKIELSRKIWGTARCEIDFFFFEIIIIILIILY